MLDDGDDNDDDDDDDDGRRRRSLRIPAGPGHLVCSPRWFFGLRLSPLIA